MNQNLWNESFGQSRLPALDRNQPSKPSMRVACIFFSHPVRLAEFAQACFRFSPQIALRDPDVVFIEIGKCNQLYSEQGFLARIQVLLKRFGYQARVSIADDIPTALAFARALTCDVTCDDTKAIDHLPLETLYDFGDPFAVDPIGRKSIGKMIEALKRLGIQKMSQFKALPSHQLPSRFGSLGLFCRQQIEDGGRLPWPYWEPPEVLFEQIDFLNSEFCSELEPLLFKAKEGLDRIFSRLRGKSLRADRIRFSLELERYSTVKNPCRTWTFELITPQGSTSGFLPILKERLNWDLQQHPIESYVTQLKITILSSSAAYDAQRNFFHAHEEFNERMGSFFGQMEEFLGKGQVFWAALTEERFPEKSWVKSRISNGKKVCLNKRYPKRPTRILQFPISIFIVHNRIMIQGRPYLIKSWSPVEKLSLGWLHQKEEGSYFPSDKNTYFRNYYQVELEKGSTVWVFMDSNQQYFLHGYYE